MFSGPNDPRLHSKLSIPIPIPDPSCETGCQIYIGNEIRHDVNCFWYPESRTQMYDLAKEKIKLIERELSELRLRLCVLSPEQDDAIFKEACTTVFEAMNESESYMEMCVEAYVLQMCKAEQLAAISDDPICQKDLLGFDPETGAVWTEDENQPMQEDK